ncbi:hypothetical protein SH1V18_32260 [Vallitalea longa]|uniref:Uncharacterized protein n=1 Tax=Vallitalea longa TaxID=2936439 RepID=A0A9W5YDQ1_9FIRM|nr:DUF6709 family protein [Vallitalea longa]GKX30746.1 hypothetical protein SH1V18_32260 [Vallitalea longa]
METLQFIERYNKNRRNSIWGLAILLIVEVILAIMCLISYDKSTNNPAIINDFEDFNKAIANNEYAHLEISDYIDLGSVQTKRKNVTFSETFYIGININDKILVVSIKNDDYYELAENTSPTYLLKGRFGKIGNELHGTLEELLKDIVTPEELNNMMYDKLLSCEIPTDTLTSKFIIMSFIFFIIIIRIYVIYKKSRNFQKLRKQHNTDFDMFLEKVDIEIKNKNILEKDPIIITENYIISNCSHEFFVYPKSDLMWVYKEVTRYNRVFKSSNITFVFADKSKYEFGTISDKDINEIIEYFSRYGSKCIVGYSNELNKMYKKHTNAFIQQWRNKYKDAQ